MKNKVYIVEGAQGGGKTTLTRILRERKTYSVLISLTGTSDKTVTGEQKVFLEHNMALRMIDNCKGCDLNFILDRSWITERVYCQMGHTNYSFDTGHQALKNYLNHIAETFDVYYITLTASAEDYENRLKRDKPQHASMAFSIENSLTQQELYLNIYREMQRSCPNVNSIVIDTTGKDPYDIAYDILEGSK